MRVLTIIAAASVLVPAALAAHPAPDPVRDQRQAKAEHGRTPVMLRAPDGSMIIARPLPAYPAELVGDVRISDSDKVAPSPLGRRRSPSEQAIDEDLERAVEQAADMARFGAPD